MSDLWFHFTAAARSDDAGTLGHCATTDEALAGADGLGRRCPTVRVSHGRHPTDAGTVRAVHSAAAAAGDGTVPGVVPKGADAAAAAPIRGDVRGGGSQDPSLVRHLSARAAAAAAKRRQKEGVVRIAAAEVEPLARDGRDGVACECVWALVVPFYVSVAICGPTRPTLRRRLLTAPSA